MDLQKYESSDRLLRARRHYEAGTAIASVAIGLLFIGLIGVSVIRGAEVFRKSQTNASFVDIQRLAESYDNFTLRYNAVPGDVGQADALLPPCDPGGGSPNCPSGNGNGSVDRVGSTANGVTLASALDPVLDRETTLFWYHLQASGLFSALIDPSLPTTIVAFGRNLPEAEAGGGYRVRSMHVANQKGLYVLWHTRADAAADANGSQMLRAVDAAYLDAKYDDGDPNTGSVRAIANAVTNTCTTAADGPYRTGAKLDSCSLAIKIAEPVGVTSVAMAINNACTPQTVTTPAPCPPGTVGTAFTVASRICPMSVWTSTLDTSGCAAGPPPTNGVCAAALFTCTAGTVANTNVPASTWDCLGLNGGANASCSIASPPPPPPPNAPCPAQNNYNYMGGCHVDIPFSPHGTPRALVNITPGFNGGWSAICNNGVWTPVAPTCI